MREAHVTVTFNYRYSPRNGTAPAGSLASGAIGDVTSVHFEWVLDRSTVRTTSAAGTGTSRSRAACSCTSPAITSTW